ncbi:MAG: cation transporter [Bdellovibrionota bacterium]
MKKLFLVAALALLPLSGFAGEANVKVNGMVCSFCTSKLEKSFKAKDEVNVVHVDLDKKNVHLVFKDQKNLSDDEIKKIITEAGYNVVRVER